MGACLVIVITPRDVYIGRIRVHTCTVAIIVVRSKKHLGLTSMGWVRVPTDR